MKKLILLIAPLLLSSMLSAQFDTYEISDVNFHPTSGIITLDEKRVILVTDSMTFVWKLRFYAQDHYTDEITIYWLRDTRTWREWILRIHTDQDHYTFLFKLYRHKPKKHPVYIIEAELKE